MEGRRRVGLRAVVLVVEGKGKTELGKGMKLLSSESLQRLATIMIMSQKHCSSYSDDRCFHRCIISQNHRKDVSEYLQSRRKK